MRRRGSQRLRERRHARVRLLELMEPSTGRRPLLYSLLTRVILVKRRSACLVELGVRAGAVAGRAAPRLAGARARPKPAPGPRVALLVVEAERPGGARRLAGGAAGVDTPRAAARPLVAAAGPLRAAGWAGPRDGGAAGADRVAMAVWLRAAPLVPLERPRDGWTVVLAPPLVRVAEGADAVGVEVAGPDTGAAAVPLPVGGLVDAHPAGTRVAAEAEHRRLVGPTHLHRKRG